MMKTLLFFVHLLSFNLWAQDLVINSMPDEANIYIRGNANEPSQLLGKTPFKQPIQNVIKNYVKKNSFIVEIEKEGYEVYRIVLAKTTSSEVDLSVNLKVDRKIATIKEHDSMMVELFSIQKLIRSGNYQSAIGRLDELEKKYKHFSIIAELKATAFYLNKDIEKALAYYRMAFALNSDNVDAYKMKVYLEKKLKIDSGI